MIELHQLSITLGKFRLENIFCEIPTGAYAVLMGRSGCGKTTLLETICGLRPLTSGRIVLAGRDVQLLTPQERGIGYVPQNLGLFPTYTVRQHLEFAQWLRGRKPVAGQTQELAELLGIGQLLDRGIAHLSGGEAQRVALGRALALRPQILLLDEPLSALDETTRSSLQDLLQTVQREFGTTTLHVTHQREEARQLATMVLTLENGRLIRE
jgi:ABC-type sugar transport system ATPase subunit